MTQLVNPQLQNLLDRRGFRLGTELQIGTTGIILSSHMLDDTRLGWPDDGSPPIGTLQTQSVSADPSVGNRTDGNSGRITAVEQGALTMMAYMKITGTPTDALIGYTTSAATAGQGRGFRLQRASDDTLRLIVLGSTLTGTYTSSLVIPENEWASIGASISWIVEAGGNLFIRARLYVNGKSEVPNRRDEVDVLFTGTSAFRVVLYDSDSGPTIKNHLGYAAIWSAKFSEADMQRMDKVHVDEGWGAYHDNLEAEYRVERGSGLQVNDYSGNARHLSFVAGDNFAWAADPPFTIRKYPMQMDPPSRFGQVVNLADGRTRFSGPSITVLDRPVEGVEFPAPISEWLRAAQLSVIGKPATLRIGSDMLHPDDWEPILFGQVLGVTKDPQGPRWTIALGDMSRKIDKPMRLGKGMELNANITATFTGEVPLVFEGAAVDKRGFYSTPENEDPDTTRRDGFARINDEIVKYQKLVRNSTRYAFETIARAQLGTVAAAHSIGDSAQEIFRWTSVHIATIAARLLTQDLGQNGITTPGGIILDSTELLAENNSIDGTTIGDPLRDVLPRVQLLSELEFDPASVDTIVGELADTDFTDAIDLLLDDDIDSVRKFVQDELLRLIRSVMHVRRDGRIGLAFLNANAVPVTTWTPDDLLATRWRIGWEEIVNDVLIDYGLDIFTGDFLRALGAIEADSQQKNDVAKRWELQTPFIENSADGDTFVIRTKDRIFGLLADPVPLLMDVETPLRHMGREIADVVRLSSLIVPDVDRGTTGIYEQRWLIIGRWYDLAGGKMVFRLIDVSRGSKLIELNAGIPSAEAFGTLEAAIVVEALFMWGGNFAGATTDFGLVWGRALAASTAADHLSEHTMLAGNAKRLSWNHGINSAFDIIKNGSMSESVPSMNQPSGSAALTTTFADGDQVTIEQTGADPGAENNYIMSVDVAATVVGFAGDLTTSGSGQPSVWGDSQLAEVTSGFDERTEFPAHVAGAIDALTWNTQSGDATTQIGIYKNGSLSETITLDGAVGEDQTTTTTFAAGDDLSLRYNGGTAPAEGNYALWLDYTGLLLAYGANHATTGNFGAPYQHSQATEVPGPLGSRNEVTTPTSGTSGSVRWKSAAADSTTDMKLHKNGSVSETVDLTGADGSASLTTTLAQDDEVAWEYDAGTAPGEATWNLRWSAP